MRYAQKLVQHNYFQHAPVPLLDGITFRCQENYLLNNITICRHFFDKRNHYSFGKESVSFGVCFFFGLFVLPITFMLNDDRHAKRKKKQKKNKQTRASDRLSQYNNFLIRSNMKYSDHLVGSSSFASSASENNPKLNKSDAEEFKAHFW